MKTIAILSLILPLIAGSVSAAGILDGKTYSELNDMARRVDRCLELHGARWMRSDVSLDRKRLICEFEAADAEKVRESYSKSGWWLVAG